MLSGLWHKKEALAFSYKEKDSGEVLFADQDDVNIMPSHIPVIHLLRITEKCLGGEKEILE